MALKAKVKVLRIPNVDSWGADECQRMEKDIADEVENKADAGWKLESIGGGDNFVVLIFTRQGA